MSEIRNNPNANPGAGTLCEGPRSPSRCSPVQQRGPGRHYATARKKWSKEVNIVVIECYYRSNPISESSVPLSPIQGLRGQKSPLTSFSPVTSTNLVNPQNSLTFSFNTFSTLV